MTLSGSRHCAVRHYLIVVQCMHSQCRTQRYYAGVPSTEHDAVLQVDDTSLGLTVVVTVQAVNHFYRHSRPSAPATIHVPPPRSRIHAQQQSSEVPPPPSTPDDDVGFRSANFVPDNSSSSSSFDNRNDSDSWNSTGAGEDGVYVRRRPGQPAAAPAYRSPSASGGAGAGGGGAVTTGLIVGMVILAVVVATLIGLVAYAMKNKNKNPAAPVRKQELLPAVNPDSVVVDPPPPPPPPCPPPTTSKSCQTFDHSFYVTKFRRRTPTTCLRRDYEDRLRPNCHYAMKSEFERVPRGPTDSADDARSAQNVPLNRSQVNTYGTDTISKLVYPKLY